MLSSEAMVAERATTEEKLHSYNVAQALAHSVDFAMSLGLPEALAYELVAKVRERLQGETDVSERIARALGHVVAHLGEPHREPTPISFEILVVNPLDFESRFLARLKEEAASEASEEKPKRVRARASKKTAATKTEPAHIPEEDESIVPSTVLTVVPDATFDIPETAPDPLAWRENALCAQVSPEIFFPDKGGSTREAKRICADCDVKEQCLNFALAHEERFGIWGGLSERERRKILKSKTAA